MIYGCEMVTRVYVRIKADDPEQVQDFMNTHSFEDIKQMTHEYDADYEDNILDTYEDGDWIDYQIDITTH